MSGHASEATANTWVEDALVEAAADGILTTYAPIFLMDEEELARRMASVTDAFAKEVADNGEVDFLHAFAVKSNPLAEVLKVAEKCGFGAETASIGEFRIAESVFCPQGSAAASAEAAAQSRRLVFDSPVKTFAELHYALQRRCYINVDNFTELERIEDLVDGKVPGFEPLKDNVHAIVGIRVNPQSVTSTKNSALATGGLVSKFGVALHDPGNKEQLVASYERLHEKVNLRMVHVHSGSQGLSLDTMVAGVKAIVMELVNEPRLAGILSVVDIGGGFPVDFSSDKEMVTVKDYVAALRKDVPTLFHPTAPLHPHDEEAVRGPQKRTIITEFGRAIAAKSGVLISHVEYVKMSGGRQILLQHIGADLAVRTVWQPEKWPLRVCLFDERGKSRCPHGPATGFTEAQLAEGKAVASLPDGFVLTDVSGPCCFSGCTLTRAVPLPRDIAPLRDVVVVYDVGGYYHSSFSLYNLRQMPACFVRRKTIAPDGTEVHKIVCVKEPQSVSDTMGLFM